MENYKKEFKEINKIKLFYLTGIFFDNLKNIYHTLSKEQDFKVLEDITIGNNISLIFYDSLNNCLLINNQEKFRNCRYVINIH